MIGQFGFGFYTTLMVSDSVVVISKNNNDNCHLWEWNSRNENLFAIRPYDDSELKNKHGTKVVLSLKTDQTEYLDEERIKQIVRKYTQFVNYPIILVSQNMKLEVSGSGQPLREALA